MKKLIIFLFTILSFTNVYASEISEQDAKDFIKNLADRVIDNLKSDKSKSKKIEEFKSVFNSALDTNFIAKFVVGDKYWDEANSEDKDAFLKAFEKLQVITWSRRFQTYTNQTVEITGISEAKSRDEIPQIWVNSKIVSDASTDSAIIVKWRLRKDSDIKIINIVIDVMDMAIEYKKQYLPTIRKEGLPGITKKLNEQIDKLNKEN